MYRYCMENIEQRLILAKNCLRTRDVRPALRKIRLPRPAPQKGGLAPPRPAKLMKSVGRSGAKLTAGSIDTPFHYASSNDSAI